MSPDTAAAFFKFLSGYSPPWVVLTLVAVVLAYQTPKIIRELRRKRR